MAVTINASTSSGVITTADNSGVLQLQTNSGQTAVTIDTSQNVGIGTTSPYGNTGYGCLTLNGSNGGQLVFYSGGTLKSTIFGDATNLSLYNATSTGTVLIYTNATERMRIDSAGNVLVGTTSTILSNTKFNLSSSQAAGLGGMGFVNTGASTKKWQIGPDANGNFVVFNDSTVGAYIAYGGTSWIANSDERKKDIIEPITNAVNKVSTLRAVIGKYKTDEENTRRTFLIAQDVQAVLPEAVEATNPDNLGVKYTEVIPLLVAAIKEQQTIINDLKARITALEGAA
jgi:hypothetical protein